MDYLECPCCGCEGAYPDADGYYHDGQSLICGCQGQVSLDSETAPYIMADDCTCGDEELGLSAERGAEE